MADVERLPPSTAAYVFAAALLAGVTGYFVGQGSSLRLFSSGEGEGWPNNYDVKVHKDSSDEEGSSEEEDEEASDDEENELAAFEGNTDEVKLVLVIRTDLGMTKGVFSLSLSMVVEWQPASQPANKNRQNRSTSIARHPRMLQILPVACAQLAHPAPLGTSRPGEDLAAGQVGGRVAAASGASDELGSLREGYSGCWPDADCEWESHGVGDLGSQECC